MIKTATCQFITSVDETKNDSNNSHSRHHQHHAQKCTIFIIFHDQHTSNVCVKRVIIKSEHEPKNNQNITKTHDTNCCCTSNNEEKFCCMRCSCPTEIPQPFDAYQHKHRCKIVSSAIWMTDVRWWEWLWWIDDYRQRIVKLDIVRFQAPISYVKISVGNYKIKLLLLVALCLSMLKMDKIISDHYFLPLLFHFSVVVVVIAVQTIHCVIVIVIIIIDMMRCFIINFIGNIFLYCCQHEKINRRQQHPVSDKSEQQLNILPFTRNFIVVVVVVRKPFKDAREQEKSIVIECEPYSRTTRNKNNNKFIINNRMRTKSCCDQITCNERTKWNMRDIFLSAVQGIELLIKFLLLLSISVYKSIISAGVCVSLSSVQPILTTHQNDSEYRRSNRMKSEKNCLSSRRKSSKNICTTFLLLFTCIPLIAGSSIHANVKYSTNIIKTKYGPLRGILVRTNPPVEAFLGVPYATPPIGSLR